MMLRDKIHWAWLAAVPVVYAALAVPVVVAGRPIASVFSIYMEQAGDVPPPHHERREYLGVRRESSLPDGCRHRARIGGARRAGSWQALLARSKREGPEFILLVACASLMIMPYLLPKMHDRYFFAFEVASIGLACLNARYLPFPVIAQVSGVLSYLGSEREIVMGLLPRRCATRCWPYTRCSTSRAMRAASAFRNLHGGSATPHRPRDCSLTCCWQMRGEHVSHLLLFDGLVVGTALMVIKVLALRVGSRTVSRRGSPAHPPVN